MKDFKAVEIMMHNSKTPIELTVQLVVMIPIPKLGTSDAKLYKVGSFSFPEKESN